MTTRRIGLIEDFQRGMTEPTDGGWSIAFVQYAGYSATFLPIGAVIIVAAASTPATHSASPTSSRSVACYPMRDPARGDLSHVVAGASHLHSRGGIVVDAGEQRTYPSGAAYHPCLTIEGDTDSAGMPRGHGVYLVRRNLSMDQGDRMVRWFDLAPPTRRADARDDGGRGGVRCFRDQHIDADTARAVEIAIRRHRRFIRTIARRRSNGDPDFASDLEQEAYIYMWELDPTRFDPAESGDMTYLQRALAEQMRRKMRAMNRQQPR